MHESPEALSTNRPPEYKLSQIGHVLDFEHFQELNEHYRERFGCELVLADSEGNLVFGIPECKLFPCRIDCRNCRKTVIEQTMQTGNIRALLCHDQFVIWGVPVMVNQHVYGALIAVGVPLCDPSGKKRLPEDFSEHCQGLLELAVEYNITNREFLRSRRRDEKPENGKRQVLNSSVALSQLKPKLEVHENQLEQALRRGWPTAAKEALAAIWKLFESVHPPVSREVMDAYAIQLLARAYQHVKPVAGTYATLLQMQYASFTQLLASEDRHSQRKTLQQGLEALLDFCARDHNEHSRTQINKVLSYIEKNFADHLTRKDVAKACGLSEGALSRLIKQETDRSFNEILNQYRVDRAAQLLRQTQKGLLTIALEVGFSDQSYFGRIFRTFYEMTPDQFRRNGKST